MPLTIEQTTDCLETAITGAVAQGLPHQLQRIIRAASPSLPDVGQAAIQALNQLREEIAA